LEEHGTKNPTKLSVQGTETLGTKVVGGTKTLGDKETQGIENFGDVIMQMLDDLDLDNNGTCFESIAAKVFILEDMSIEPSILYLNYQIV